MKRSRILITGGAGFIGSHLTDELLRRDCAVTVMDNLCNGSKENLREAFTNEHFSFMKADVTIMEDCLRATQDVDIIYHLACLGRRHSINNPIENHRVNCEGVLHMLEAARINCVKRFLFMSSAEIYGNARIFPIHETAIPDPLTVYGTSKLTGEYYAQIYRKSYGLDTTIVRLFNAYGPRAHYEKDTGELIPRTIVSILSDRSPVIFGKGLITRDFFYVKDLVFVLSDLMERRNTGGLTMNIGSGQEIAIKDLIEKILSLMNKTKLGISYIEAGSGGILRLLADINTFSQIMHFRPAYSFEKGLVETIEYYKNLSRRKNLFS